MVALTQCILASAALMRAADASPTLDAQQLSAQQLAGLLPLTARRPSDYNNSAMVYTYVDFSHASRALAKLSTALDVLTMWAASWAHHGWTPRILTVDDLRDDPGYKEFLRIAKETATAVSRARHGGNLTDADANFRLRGLTQFYAKAVAGSGVLTDSDVINYGLTPQGVREVQASAQAYFD